MLVKMAVVLLLTGSLVGLVSGMIGVGGCFIMVPIQFWLLTSMGIDPTIAIRVAFGSNLAVVLPTAISAVRIHHKRSAVVWSKVWILGISGLVGAMIGAKLASVLPAGILKKAFGLAVLFGAVRMLFGKLPEVGDVYPKKHLYVLWGILLGLASGIIGIGGGVLMIPVLTIFLGFDMRSAIGSSTAVMIFTSLGGILSYIYNGLKVMGLPPYSLGYVNLLQFSLLAITSIPMARLGAHLAHKIPRTHLKYLFVVVMVYMGIKMLFT